MASILTKLFVEVEQEQADLVEQIPSTSRTVCNTTAIPGSPGTSNVSLDEVDSTSQQVDFGSTYTEINGQVYEVKNDQVTPAVPGSTRTECRTHFVPSKTITTPQPSVSVTTPHRGWTGAAISNQSISENGEFKFRVRNNVTGAVVGLNQYKGHENTVYFDIDFGFIFTLGNASIIENNQIVHTLGDYATDDIFSVRRVNRVILYFKNDVLLYKSEEDGGIDFLYADASLYLSGDQVFDAEIDLNVVDEVFVTDVLIQSVSGMAIGSIRIDDEVFIQAAAFDSVSALTEIRLGILETQVIKSISSMTAMARGVDENAMTPLQAFGSEGASGQSVNLIHPFQSIGIGNAIIINVASSVSVIQRMTSHGVIIGGGLITGELQTLSSLSAIGAESEYAESINVMRPLQAFAGVFPERMVGAARLINRITQVQGSSILLWTGRHLLTAAHVAEKWTNFDAVDIDFIADDGVNLPTYKPYRVSIHPDWNPTRDAKGNAIGNFLNDIAIVEIAQYVDSFVGRHLLYIQEDELGKTFDKTSYSPRIHPETGAVSASGWDTISNKYDLVEQGYLRYDFDNGKSINDFFTSTGAKVANEGFVSSGDSGGASLIDNKVAGILSFVQGFTGLPDILPGTNFTYGEVAADIRVSAYDNWITANSNVTSPLYSVDPTIPEIKVQLRPVFSTVDIVLPALEINATASLTTLNITEVVLPSLAIEAYSGAFVELALPTLEIEAQASHSVSVTVDIVLPQLVIAATGFNGALANIDITLPLSLEIEAFGASQVNIVLPALEIDAQAVTSTKATFDIVLPGLAIEAIADTTRADVMAVIDITLPGLEFIYGAIDIVLPQLVIDAGQPVYSDAALRDDTGVAYAFNVLHGETTRYTQYDFNQIVRLNGLYYGIKAEGIYLLEGEKDGLENIAAKFKTADMDFGSTLHKRVPYVYLDTTDKTQITPFTDDRPNCTYPSNFNGRRTRLARGPKGRFWAFEVSNVNGLPLDLRSLEFYPTILSRKV